jgi:hypothetical protein
MMERLLKNVQIPGKLEQLNRKDEASKKYLSKTFETFPNHTYDTTFLTSIIDSISSLCHVNGKQYSDLKHMSYELSELILKAGKLLHKISDTFHACIKTAQDHFKKIQFNVSPRVEIEERKLQNGLSEWGTQLISQSRFIVDHMASFFHFKKHEQLSFHELIQCKKTFEDHLKRKSADLDKKKSKLYESRNIDGWKVNRESIIGDFNDLYHSFNKVRVFMLPEVNSQGVEDH